MLIYLKIRDIFNFWLFCCYRRADFCKNWGSISAFDMQKTMEKSQKGKNFSFAKRWLTIDSKIFSKKCKKIFGQFGKWLYLCTRFRPNEVTETKELWHWWEDRDSVCRTPPWEVWDTRRVKKVNKEQFLQWRVWSWLRMNASGRLNTCKSRGSAR